MSEIELSVTGSIARLQFNRPDVFNALSPNLLEGLIGRCGDLGRRAAEALAAIPQITIAAIKGYCIGGALVLSAACDLRIAADDSRFSIPELDAGIPLSWGGMAHVVRLLGESLANDLVLTCRRFRRC